MILPVALTTPASDYVTPAHLQLIWRICPVDTNTPQSPISRREDFRKIERGIRAWREDFRDEYRSLYLRSSCCASRRSKYRQPQEGDDIAFSVYHWVSRMMRFQLCTAASSLIRWVAYCHVPIRYLEMML